MESNHVSWAPPKAVHTQDTDPEWDADLQAPKANPWETMCSIFISILCIFGGEKSEYDNEFVVSTTRAVSTSAPCQHMGSCYPWRVINPTNPSNVFVLGLSLLWKCSLNCAKGSAQTLLAQAWLCPGRAQGRRAHPACPLCPCHCSGHTEQDSFLSLHQHAAWGAARKEQNSNQKGGDGAEPMEAGCPCPLHFHNCDRACAQSLNQRPGHFLTLGYLISQRFGFHVVVCFVWLCTTSETDVGFPRGLWGNSGLWETF